MHSTYILAAGISYLTVVFAAPAVAFPPNAQIEVAAHGSLPNDPPPPSVTDDTLTSIRLIAFNELSEVAFFSELLANITKQVEGFHHHDIGSNSDVAVIINALSAVIAQEGLHVLDVNGALMQFKQDAIQPCTYNFPVSKFKDAIALASTFTDVVLGTFQDIQSLLATDGDFGLIGGIGSVIDQEGEQNSFYRTIISKIPSALPFLTISTREFLFSALKQNFVLAGSCPNDNLINLKVFKTLTITSQFVEAKSQLSEFSIEPLSGVDYTTLSMTYINKQNLPIIEPIQNIEASSVNVKT